MKKHKRITLLLVLALGIVYVFLVLSTIPKPDIKAIELLDRNGFPLRKVSSSENGTAFPVKVETLPKHFITTVINTEDKRFYNHLGIDFIAIARAFRGNLRERRVVSGGSTITQQLVRNIHHYPRNIFTKVYEAASATCIEIRYSKKRILEEYLNRIPYGNGTYGVEAASKLYFAKSASGLTLAESAFLTAIPSATKIYDPYRNFSKTEIRQKNILTRLFLKGKISKEDFESACNEKVALFPKEKIFFAPHFCEYVLSKYKNVLSGPAVSTTLDYSLQREIEYIVQNNLSQLERANVTNASVVVLDNRTGDIISMVGSADYFNEENSGQVNGATSLRQPGSSIKPFIYGLAFESGFMPSYTLADIETHFKIQSNGDFIPKNYDKKYHGMVRARTALACSYNVATVNLAQKLGPDIILSKLHQAGFDSLKENARFYGPGLSLGSGEVTLLEITRAYSGFARSGRLIETRMLLDESLKDLGIFFSPEVSYIITDILSDNQAREPAFGEFSALNFPFKCAVKTGTSKNFRDNWTIGYTPRYTVGVWAGNFSGRPMYSVSGISGAAPIFRDIILFLERKKDDLNFKEPKSIKRVTICAKSGKLPNKYCTELMEEIYLKDNVVKETCNIHRMCRIDTRNGMIAYKDCSEQFVKNKVFEIYPVEYYNWCLESGLEMPPSRISNIEDGYPNRFDIDYPHDCDVFQIDPVLRREYQVITLKPNIDSSIPSIKWFIDDQPLNTVEYPFALNWQLQEGKHKINFIATTNEGKLVKSRNIEITVLN